MWKNTEKRESLEFTRNCGRKKRARWRVILILAERKGFEPSIRYKRIHAFQACDFNRSSTSPKESALYR